MTPHPKAETQPSFATALSAGGWFTSSLCAAALMFAALIALWLDQASQHVYSRGADALVIRAVLRTDADNLTAENLAVRVRDQVPDATIEIINEAMGRSLLALQEPWIAQMPDFEVTPLPILLEIHHPDLLTKPAEVAAFAEELGKQPEVDLVTYNETAHDRLVKLAEASNSIGNHTLRWLLAGIIVAGFAAQYVSARLSLPQSLLSALIQTAVEWLPGWVFAWLAFRWWQSIAIETGDWQPLSVGTHITVAVSALLLMIIATVSSWGLYRSKP